MQKQPMTIKFLASRSTRAVSLVFERMPMTWWSLYNASTLVCSGNWDRSVTPPYLLDQLILWQRLLHGCDLQSLTPAFIQEWFPSLYRTLTDWNAIHAPSGGSIEPFDAHFQLFHDFPVFLSILYILSLSIDLCCFNRFHAFRTELKKHTRLLQLRCFIEQP